MVKASSFNGWGKTKLQSGERIQFSNQLEVERVLDSPNTTVLPSGSLRSYHDTALNGNGVVLDLTSLKGMKLSSSDSSVEVGAGVTIKELQSFLSVNGFSLWVLPGTWFVTVGGAIASDIHGKSHHLFGTFSKHVKSFEILLSSGEICELFPQGKTSNFFWATVGGIGLTGVILSAKISIRPIKSNLIDVHEVRTHELEETMQILREQSPGNEESVAWLDIGKKGRGRGLISFGNLKDLDKNEISKIERKSKSGYISIPNFSQKGIVNNYTIKRFNHMWFNKKLKNGVFGLPDFHAPLDSIYSWNNLYGKKGLLQYQFVIPFGEEAFLRYFLEEISRFGGESPLSILKTFGVAGEGLLSFPKIGWTLAVDFPYTEKTVDLLRGVTLDLINSNGRTYFAKDLMTHSSLISKMYPQVDKWKEIQKQMDPRRKWMSDQAGRLGLL
jgi:decaprenylphospho-beta-D-ribofuranose 2-oxidase